MEEKIDERIEGLDDRYVMGADYERQILDLAPMKEIQNLKTRLNFCALQDNCVQ